MADVKWIKLNVGMFDGNSFKKIKKAKIGGESYRDKLFIQTQGAKGLSYRLNSKWIHLEPVINDNVIDTVEDYEKGIITAEQALGQLKYKKVNHQICIINQFVIERYLRYIQSIQ